ncbi:hypothetical protein [Mesorhizobium sp. L2C066B000]|uniref:hypothetical protein n=1 Tax=Mesorhizobium sp. L2C066B000 TaxID=1287105 RepID=UPI0003CFE318|nr:hypothetical protein [Mesorhizobium sp. L2C066B000]ESZ35092.1 hypothetical protein X732_25615 [Mesorhizobium sp. L2C066B000]
MTAATADDLLGSGKKEKPDQGGRAKEKSQNKEDTPKPGSGKSDAESQKDPPKREPRVPPPDRNALPIKWPYGITDQAKAERRALRDEWMTGVHGVFADDIIALRLLWPLFNSMYVDSSQRCFLSNGQLAAQVRRSISVVKRGLDRLHRAGWTFPEETHTFDDKGKPITLRKIGFAFPEGYIRIKKGRAGAAPGGEAGSAGNAAEGAGAAPASPGAAQSGAPQDPHSPLGTSPGDGPLDAIPKKGGSPIGDLLDKLKINLLKPAETKGNPDHHGSYIGKGPFVSEAEIIPRARHLCKISFNRLSEQWYHSLPRQIQYVTSLPPQWVDLTAEQQAEVAEIVVATNRHLVAKE